MLLGIVLLYDGASADSTTVETVKFLPPLPPGVHRPHTWMPTHGRNHPLTPDEQFRRKCFWGIGLSAQVLLAACLVEGVGQAIKSFRTNNARGDSVVVAAREEDDAAQEEEDSPTMIGHGFVPLHISFHAVCVAIAAYAVHGDWIGIASGMNYELWALWMSLTLVDITVQVIIRSATAPLSVLGVPMAADKVVLSVAKIW